MAIKPQSTLNQRLALIGFRINFPESAIRPKDLELIEEADLEETLIRAADEARKDFRILSLLMTWISVHADYVIVEKFLKKQKAYEKIRGINRVLDLMAAQAVISGSHKWKRLIRTSNRRSEVPLDPELLAASIEFQGADEQLKRYGILVPKKLIRVRPEDVFSTSELGKVNRQFRNRLLYGASWRADIITAIELGAKNPHQISRLLGCSYEPAYRIFNDYRAAHGHAA